MDYVDSLGTAFLAHRLRRLSDSVVEQVTANFARAGLTVPARSVSTLSYLSQNGPTGPVELGKALKFSHPLMVRALRNLEALGLVEAVPDETDQRRRRVQLTEAGRSEAERSMRLALAFTAQVERVASEAGLDLGALSTSLEGFTKLFAEQDIRADIDEEAGA